jgi:crotonobetainyl-CoA:carnitine CoA-transferase CaiB-like acyl-CoA transferase
LPLDDVQVLDLGMVWAGPYCGRLLASLGAAVVKVEGPRHPDGTRQAGTGECAGVFADLNQGKASLALDLATTEGRELFLRLVRSADAVVENFSPRVMPNFGLEAATLTHANPALIMLSMPAFGSTGPWANYVAYGSGLELATGLAAEGRDGQPEPAAVPYLDYLAGAYGAAAIVAALLARDRSGRGCHLEVAQREVACQLLSPPPLRPDRVGASRSAGRARRAPRRGRDGVRSAGGVRKADRADRSAGRGRVRARGKPARYGELDADELAADPRLAARGLLASPDPGAPCVHFARSPWRIVGVRARPERQAPALGADSRAVLRAAGVVDADIDRLVAAGIVLDSSGPDERPA